MNRVAITSADDERISVFLGLRDHAARQVRERPGGDRAGSFIAEGDLVIDRALAAGHELEAVLIDALRTKALPEAVGARVPVYAAAPSVLEEITGRAELRDPLACFRRPEPASIDAVLADATVVAVLEGVNNPNNLGVIMRNAAALGIDAVLLDPTCGDPLYRRAIRASMGQVFAVPHARLDRFPPGLERLHSAGLETIALTPAASTTLDDLQCEAQRVAVVLGAEGAGLEPSTLAAATHRVRIPMNRGVDSLNVASAAAIAFHRLRRSS